MDSNSANSTSTPVLEGIGLTKVYDMGEVKIRALKGVDIQILPGDFTTIVGKSGSGKSTLMHIMGLLDTPTEGQVVLHGKDTTQYSSAELARVRNKEIGFVFQSFNLLARTSTLDNVILPLKYSNTPKAQWEKKATDVLKRVGLGDRLQNKSNELSGGQKQRVAIARALVNDPAIILADEPTGNLDSKTGESIEQLLIDLNKEGKTIIIVTHDEDLARITPKKVTLHDGLIVS
ncbi:ATP-binding cassette domain-containing protein [candidate division WWE3 bacterium]|nr:ATP-binding cassette domain-containing protein [candidate division WWE3 bacterium]